VPCQPITASILKQQKPCVLWVNCLSGSGKSSVANLVENILFDLNKHTYLLDGDNVRRGFNKGLGFSEADRIENIHRVGEVANLFCDSGLIVITAFISLFSRNREMARNLIMEGQFVEVFIDVPLGVCEQRDSKGLYKKARTGEIKDFTDQVIDYLKKCAYI